MTRLPAAVLAALLLPVVAAAPASAAEGPALSVDASLDRWAISPDVYGMNFADPALQTELGLSLSRWGGNATSRYNWTNNTTNLASDWYFENLVRPAGQSLDTTIAGNKSRGTRTVVTVPMTGWVAKDSPSTHPFACGFSIAKYGPQTGNDHEWDPDCGNGVKATGGNVTGNDPLDTSVAAGAPFVKSMVAHLVATHGAGGRYNLDNEPSLWNSTHRDVHPAAVTYDELRDRSVATAKAVKEADPTGEVAGPAEWGWCAYFYSPADAGGCGNGADRAAHGGTPMAQWYLQQLKAASDSAGKRLLDTFDEHYYPQASNVALRDDDGSSATRALRLRSTRSLWDPTYSDESWIGGDVGAPPIRLIPWMRELVAASYPGTKTMIGEYNWGALDSMNGALAQADVLGIFGRERLDRALLWSPPTTSQPGAYAFRMYRNYDGAGSRFGQTNVRATSGDQSKLAVYAAQRAPDGAVTVMVVNKTSTPLTAPLALAGAKFGAGAQRWAYSPTNLSAIRRLADVPVANGAASATYEPDSITLLVLPTVTPAVTALAPLVTSLGTVYYGRGIGVTGRLTSGGAPLAGRVVQLQAQRRGTTSWVDAGSATTDADGRLRKAVVPQWSGTLRWRWPGDASYATSTSPAAGITVQGRVDSALDHSTVVRGYTARLTGSVAPRHPGARVALQRRALRDDPAAFRTVGYAYLSPASTFAFSIRHTTAGLWYYRVLWVGDTDHAPRAGTAHGLTVR